MRAQLPPSSTLVLTTLLAVVPGNALAQVIPDNTLGAEGSLIIPATSTEGSPLNRIEGGAIRGSNLFHSFLEFNIDAGQQLYFANPNGIATILSRVTGSSPSQILGTLGVEGPADLFLLNPNGIVFGPEASLDIAGSFYATTAGAIPLGDGIFSAVKPEQSSLLSVSPSAVFSTYLTEATGDIQSQGKLTAGENLSLAANRLDLQGQLAANGDLILLAGDTVQIRDSTEAPFTAIAGNDLLVQGNEQVDIVVLSHPDSGLYSYGDMTLRSASAVGGDARYWSGGTFRVETLDGSSGSLYCPVDPIIRAFGDVTFDFYKGTSLHILAGGSVSIGTAVITATDGGKLGVDFLQETIELSDGTQVAIDGGAQPTLDVRAGVRPDVIGTPPLEVSTGFNSPLDLLTNASEISIASSADITVGDVFIAAPDGLVLLTNQYEPNPNIPGGSIFVTGEGIYGDGVDARGFGKQGGTIFLDARKDITATNSFISTTGAGEVGDVVLIAGETVRFDSLDGSPTGASSDLESGTEGTGGSVRIRAATLEVLGGARLTASTAGQGNSGNVILEIRDTARFEGASSSSGSSSGAASRVELGGKGVGGNVQIQATNLEVLGGAQLSTSLRGEGVVGSVILEIAETARFTGFNPEDDTISGAFSNIQANSRGVGGNVQIRATNLEVLDGAALSTSVLGEGTAGSVIVEIADTARFEGVGPTGGSGATSSIQRGGQGAAGNVRIRATNLKVLDGAQLLTSTFNVGDAGNIILDVRETALFDGNDPRGKLFSAALSQVEPGAEGRGGNVFLRAANLQVLNGAQLAASTFAIGDAGNVILEISGTARFAGVSGADDGQSGAFSVIGVKGQGTGGNVILQTNNLEVSDGAVLGTSVLGNGSAGNVVLNIANTARFQGSNSFDGNASAAVSRIESGGEGAGGNLQIRAANLEVLDGARLTTSVEGAGIAGNISLDIINTARFEGSNPTNGSASGAFSRIDEGGKGAGGNIQIRAADLEVLHGAQLSASTAGEGEAGTVLLEIANTARFAGFNSTDGNPGGVFSTVQSMGTGRGNDIRISASRLEISDEAFLFAGSLGQGEAGNVVLNIRDLIQLTDGDIATNAEFNSGGQIQIQAGNLLLLGDSDIQTFVRSGENSGGNITIDANFLIALDDSDILAFAVDGRGGNIDFTRTAFLGQDFQIAPPGTDPTTLDGNSRVDISATGRLASGTVALPDVSFIENSLNELAETAISPETLTAGSCIARSGANGSFIVSGSDGLPSRPGEVALAPFATGSVQPFDEASAQGSEVEQVPALQEPEGLYQLADGRLVLSHVCQD